LRRIKMVLGVAAAMAMMLVAFVAPAMAQTNEFNDSEQYDFVISGDRDWNDHNNWNDHYDWNHWNDDDYYSAEYLEYVEEAYEEAYEDFVDEVEDDEGSYLGFNPYSNYYW
jgi:hypothetical protein